MATFEAETNFLHKIKNKEFKNKTKWNNINETQLLQIFLLNRHKNTKKGPQSNKDEKIRVV